jgi:hypothetical protein
MPVMPVQEYVKQRERYDYQDPDCRFEIRQTGSLSSVGEFQGVYPTNLPTSDPKAVNLRRFEIICQEVFLDCSQARKNGDLTSQNISNLKSITLTN